jgi:hypothetical protein
VATTSSATSLSTLAWRCATPRSWRRVAIDGDLIRHGGYDRIEERRRYRNDEERRLTFGRIVQIQSAGMRPRVSSHGVNARMANRYPALAALSQPLPSNSRHELPTAPPAGFAPDATNAAFGNGTTGGLPRAWRCAPTLPCRQRYDVPRADARLMAQLDSRRRHFVR